MQIQHNQTGASSHHTSVRLWPVFFFLFTLVLSAAAKAVPYGGALGGIATLSADGGSQMTTGGLSLSSYAPSNGGALDLFAGAHLHDYFSLQGDFIWNRNNLRLNSTSSSSGVFYHEDRGSSQQAAVVSLLVYFRDLGSRVRPYLAVGTGVNHFSSTLDRVVAGGGTAAPPPATFSSTGPVLRTHVGVDLRLVHNLAFRYSFSETIGKNEISKQLSPPAPRHLANFQNLFGFVVSF